MAHPIIELQTGLVAALLADAPLVALLGGSEIFDAPPKAQTPPYIAVVRHDILPRDGDNAPGFDHRILLHCWHSDASRAAVLEIVNRVLTVVTLEDLSSVNLTVTHAQHDRTDTAIDTKTGQARAAIAMRFYSETSA